jgi:hypothetical protein
MASNAPRSLVPDDPPDLVPGSESVVEADLAQTRPEAAKGLAASFAGTVTRPIRGLALRTLLLVPLHVAALTVLLLLAGRVAGWNGSGDGIAGTVVGWSSTIASMLTGLLCGVVAGLASAGTHTLAAVETEVRGVLLALPGSALASRLPAIPLSDARARYEDLLDRMADAMFGAARVPGFVRRLVRQGLRQAHVEDLLGEGEARGRERLGLAEASAWLAASALPAALAPARARLRLCRAVGLGIPALIATAALLAAAIA